MLNNGLVCAIITAIIVAASGCSEVVGPSELTIDGFRITFSVAPDAVAAKDTFTARLVITNTRPSTAEWTKSSSCLAFLDIYRDGIRIPFEGTSYGCLTVITSREIEPGDSLVRRWTLRARRRDGAPVQPGEYRVVAELNDRDALKLEQRLTIR